MVYVGFPFAHDIFISYSQGLPDPDGPGSLARWSGAFAQGLESEIRLNPKLRTYTHFRDVDHRPDRSVDPMAPLGDGLRQHIRDSAILLVLMSPDYLASRWCKDEREWWCAHQSELGFLNKDRIAVVRILPTDAAWPPELVDLQGEQLVGFTFHPPVIDNNEAETRPFGWPDMRHPDSDASKMLVRIAGRLSTKLSTIKERLDGLQREKLDAERLSKPDGLSIYLHGRADNAQKWEQAGIDLTDSGFQVFPGNPDPVEKNAEKLQEIREQRVEMMCSCDALLLLGSEDGRALDHDLVVVGKYDRQSARARTDRLLPCGVLDTVGMPVSTPVRKATARLLQADWLDGTQPPWAPAIRKWLLAMKPVAEATP